MNTLEASPTLEGKQYTWETEVDIVRLILHNPKALNEFQPYLHPSFFRKGLQSIVKIATKYWQSHRKLVPSDVLAQEYLFEVSVGLTPEKQQYVLNVLAEVAEPPQHPEYSTTELQNFLRFQGMDNAVKSAVDILDDVEKTKDYSKLPEVVKLFTDAYQYPEQADEDTIITVPPMPESALYGWVGEKAQELNSPLGFAYPAMLGISAAMDVPHDMWVRPTLYVALLGAKGKGKSVTITRAKQTLFLNESLISQSVPASDKGLFKIFEADQFKGKTVLLELDEIRHLMTKINITGSSLAPALCKLWNFDKDGSSDKTGNHEVDIRLNILGNLTCKDADEFADLFGGNTTAGFADRFIFGWGDGFEWKKLMIQPDHRLPVSCSVPDHVLDTVSEWVKQGEERGRLGELAQRIALITSSMNQDYEITEESIQAALSFMEWQEQLRKYFKPSEATVLDGKAAEAILNAVKQGKPQKWNRLASNRHWYEKYGTHRICSARDALAREGRIIYRKPPIGTVEGCE